MSELYISGMTLRESRPRSKRLLGLGSRSMNIFNSGNSEALIMLFSELFERVEIGRDSDNNPIYAIHAKYSLYSDGDITAGGISSGVPGDNLFKVTFSDEGGNIVSDKTFEEISEARDSGAFVYGEYRQSAFLFLNNTSSLDFSAIVPDAGGSKEILTITIDSNDVVSTASTPIGGGSDSVFVVYAHADLTTQEITSVDKTFSEITAAYNDGKLIFAYVGGGVILPMLSITDQYVEFGSSVPMLMGIKMEVHFRIQQDDTVTLKMPSYFGVIGVMTLPVDGSDYVYALVTPLVGGNYGKFYKWNMNTASWDEVSPYKYFQVNFHETSQGLYADKTYVEIQSAMNGGCYIYGYYGDTYAAFNGYGTGGGLRFTAIQTGMTTSVITVIIDSNDNITQEVIPFNSIELGYVVGGQPKITLINGYPFGLLEFETVIDRIMEGASVRLQIIDSTPGSDSPTNIEVCTVNVISTSSPDKEIIAYTPIEPTVASGGTLTGFNRYKIRMKLERNHGAILANEVTVETFNLGS